MDITLLSIVFFLLLAVILLALVLFKSINKKTFIADDGSVFENQSNLDLYQRLYQKTKPLFSLLDENVSSQSLLGFEKSFLSKLTSEAFPDLKTLVKYRKQFKLLSDLINT